MAVLLGLVVSFAACGGDDSGDDKEPEATPSDSFYDLDATCQEALSEEASTALQEQWEELQRFADEDQDGAPDTETEPVTVITSGDPADLSAIHRFMEAINGLPGVVLVQIATQEEEGSHATLLVLTPVDPNDAEREQLGRGIRSSGNEAELDVLVCRSSWAT